MRWLKTDNEYLQTINFVAFDTETTGLWAPVNRIVEIGAVKFRLGRSKVERFSELVNPERAIPGEVIAIHGITDSMVAKAETIETVLEQFIEFCGTGSLLIAHNAMFDISFVGCESDRCGIDLMPNPVLDTVDIFRKASPGLDSYSLLSLARHFKLAVDQSHRAADDAALVWKLFSMIAKDFPVFSGEGEFKRAFTFFDMAQWAGERQELPEEFSDIELAVNDNLSLEIVYATEGRPAHKRIIKPRRLHCLGSVFYVAAFCEKAQAERTFRLDRIRSFSLLK